MMYFKKFYEVILKEAKFWANYYANGISLALNCWFLLLIFFIFFAKSKYYIFKKKHVYLIKIKAD